MRKHLRALAVLVLATSACVASAHDVVAGLDEQALLFGDIPSVFTASKFEQKTTDAPSSVSIVTSEEIRRYGYRTLKDILASLRSLVTSYDRTYSYVGGRGFALPGDYNSRILFLIDGVRANDPIYSQGMIGTEFMLDVDLIDRIEFVRGPASSLYGADALFGVLNIVTKRGRDLGGAEAAASIASLGTRAARASAGKRLAGNTEFLLSASAYQSQGQTRLYYPEFDDPATNDGIAENRDGDRARSLFLKASLGDLSLEAGFVSRTKEIPTATFGTVFNHPGNEYEDTATLAAVSYQHHLENGADLTARLSYHHVDYDGVFPFDLAANPGIDPPDVHPDIDYSRARRWSAEVFASRQHDERHNLTAGAEFRTDTQLDQGNYIPGGDVYLDDQRRTKSWAAYLQDEFRVDEHLLLNVGLRFDHFDTFGNTANPRLGAVYNLAQSTWLKLLYGTGFRAPTPFELYYYDGGFTSQPALDLDPEHIRTTELVLEHYFRPQLLGTLALFCYRLENLIAITDGTGTTTGLLVFRNADRTARVRGAEAELEGRLAKGWRGRFSYSYTDTSELKDLFVASYAPIHLAKLNLIAPLGEQTFAGLELQYTGARPTVQGGSVDRHTLANLTLTGEEWWPGLTLSASLYNLLDTDYADPVSEEFAQEAIPQDGRQARIKVGYRF
jgi:iron complex outermembrane receptor protein